MRNIYLREQIRDKLKNFTDNPNHDEDFGEYFTPKQLDVATDEILEIFESSGLYLKLPAVSPGEEVYYCTGNGKVFKSVLHSYVWNSVNSRWDFYIQDGMIKKDAVFKSYDAAANYLKKGNKE